MNTAVAVQQQSLSEADLIAQQAYSDILPRIEALEALSEDSLKTEMHLLKKCLLENPAACELMLPQDIGKLVTALRRVTGQALAAAAAKPKKGAAKNGKLFLTAEQIADAFDEL